MTDHSREALPRKLVSGPHGMTAFWQNADGTHSGITKEDCDMINATLSTRPAAAVDVEAIARKAYRMFNHPMVSGYTESAWLRDFGAYLRQALAGAAPGSEWQEYAGSIVKAYPGWKVWVSPDGFLYHAPIGFRPPLPAAPQGE